MKQTPEMVFVFVLLALNDRMMGGQTLYFTVMQPIGFFVWIYQAQFKKEEQEFVARKLDAVGWTKYLSISAIW